MLTPVSKITSGRSISQVEAVVNIISSIRKRPKRAIKLLIVGIVVLYCAHGIVKQILYTRPIPNVHAVIITEGGDHNLRAYDCRTATEAEREYDRMPEQYAMDTGFAQFEKLRPVRYLFMPSDDSEQFAQSQLMKDVQTKTVNGQYEDCCQAIACYSHQIYLLFLEEQGRLVRCYDATGKRISQVRLNVKDVGTPGRPNLSITKDHIVVELTKKTDYDACMAYIFDRNGRLIKVFSPAYNPQCSEDGHYLSYFTRDSNYSEKSERIIIYDLRKMRIKKVLSSCPYTGYLTKDYRLAPDGGSLIFSYRSHGAMDFSGTAGAYAVDISKDPPKWYKLPIDTDHIVWVVLSEMPEEFKPVSKEQ